MYHLQHVDVLCLPVDGKGNVHVGDENEHLLVYLLQHDDVLCLPVDGEGDVLVGDEDELLHGNFFQFVDVSIVKKANYGQRGNSEITWLRPGYYNLIYFSSSFASKFF